MLEFLSSYQAIYVASLPILTKIALWIWGGHLVFQIVKAFYFFIEDMMPVTERLACFPWDHITELINPKECCDPDNEMKWEEYWTIWFLAGCVLIAGMVLVIVVLSWFVSIPTLIVICILYGIRHIRRKHKISNKDKIEIDRKMKEYKEKLLQEVREEYN